MCASWHIHICTHYIFHISSVPCMYISTCIPTSVPRTEVPMGLTSAGSLVPTSKCTLVHYVRMYIHLHTCVYMYVRMYIYSVCTYGDSVFVHRCIIFTLCTSSTYNSAHMRTFMSTHTVRIRMRTCIHIDCMYVCLVHT